jgi:hypothetical protein
MDVNVLTLGYDCSPAAALRNLNMREFALPFDWVVSSVQALSACIRDNFEHFHCNLRFNHSRTRLIDHYGFQFPHDYPITGSTVPIDISASVGEGVIGEERGQHIVDDWNKYYGTVKEKYARRNERFRSIIADSKSILVLCRYSTRDVHYLKIMFKALLNREDIYFVNSSQETYRDDKIINVFTEKNNIWNEASLWKEAIDTMISNIH